MSDDLRDACRIIGDLLSSTLMPKGDWSSARPPYVWEREGLDFLAAHREFGCGNAWTKMLLDEGYPAAKGGHLQGRFWKAHPTEDTE